jgi:DNA-binding NarL/FixJ family response regulator
MNRPLQLRPKSTTVLVLDSLELRRAGVVSFLTPWANDNNIKIVPIDPHEALAQSSASLFKMILLVIGAQGVADAEPQAWIAALHAKFADTPLVLVSEREEPEEVVAAFKAGARGFVPMSVTPPMAIQAFTFIMSGGSFFPPTALIRTTHIESTVRVISAREAPALGDVHKGLTARQQEVLERLRQGESNKLIGRQLKLRESTVKVHIRQIMRKLGATNRTQAALSAEHLALSSRVKNDGSEADRDDPDLGGAKHVLHS